MANHPCRKCEPIPGGRPGFPKEHAPGCPFYNDSKLLKVTTGYVKESTVEQIRNYCILNKVSRALGVGRILDAWAEEQKAEVRRG